jgi:imidazolonepropionase-like amidohydrolase
MKNCLFRLLMLVIISVLLLTPELKAQAPIKTNQSLVMSNVTVIDGNGGRPMPNMTLVISGGRISDMYRAGKKKSPAEATVMDLAGSMLFPV